MLNTSYKRITARIAAIKAEADVSTGKPTGQDRAGARIRGNLYRGQGGQFQAGPAGQLRQRIEAIREMRKQRKAKPKGKGKGRAKPAGEKDSRTPQEIANQNRAAVAEATGMADLEAVIVRLGAGMDSELEKESHDKLIGQGLAKRNADGSVTLTPAGKAWRRAADKGDQDGAATALAEGKAGAANREARDKERADKKEAREKKEKTSSSGGSKEKKKPEPKEESPAPTDKAARATSNRAAVADKMMANDAGVTKKGLDAMAGLASGEGEVDDTTVDQLSAMGLVEKARDGTPRLTTQGRAAVRAAEKGDYGATVDAISRAGDAVAERREKEQELSDLEEEAPSDEELVSEAAATVGLEDQDVDDLRTAADEGGASNATLQSAGLVDKDGAATAEGVDALEALERGDIRGYRRAARKARARVRKEKGSADRAATDKQQAVSEEVARIDRARGRGGADRGRGTALPRATKAQEQAHTGVMVALFVPEIASLPGVTEPADMLHVTLAYLGKTEEIQLSSRKDRLVEALSAWASSQPPLTGVVNGLGRFFNEESDGTNAVYAAPDVPGLAGARGELLHVLRRSGIYAADNHGFTPHITVAYVSASSPTPDIRFEPIPVAFDAVTLAWGDERIAFPFEGAVKSLLFAVKHGKHDQSSHGRATARRSGMRAAYSSARAGGASVADARAEANNVSAIHRQQQRMANIERQLDGEISERQRSSLGAEHDRLKGDTQARLAKVRDAEHANTLGSQTLEPTVRGRMGALHDYDQRLSVSRARHQEAQNKLEAARRDLQYRDDALASAQGASSSIRRQYSKDRAAAQREVRHWEGQAKEHAANIRKNERLYEGELARPQMTQRRAEIMGDRAHLTAHREGRPQDAARDRADAEARAREGGKPKRKGRNESDTLPQNLSDTTPKQRRALVDEHTQMPPTELRRRLLLNRDQLLSAYEQQRNAAPGSVEAERLRRGVDNLMFRQGIIMAAQDRQDKPNARTPKP